MVRQTGLPNICYYIVKKNYFDDLKAILLWFYVFKLSYIAQLTINRVSYHNYANHDPAPCFITIPPIEIYQTVTTIVRLLRNKIKE